MDPVKFHSVFLTPLVSLFYSRPFSFLKDLINSPAPLPKHHTFENSTFTQLERDKDEQFKKALKSIISKKRSSEYRKDHSMTEGLSLQRAAKPYERVKVGDVIFLKFNFKREEAFDRKLSLSRLQLEPKKATGIVIGEFDFFSLANKSPRAQEKHAHKCFKKALFEIESERKLSLGISLAFGDAIRLRHVASGKLVAIKAREINRFGGLDLIFPGEETQEDTSFLLVPGDRTKDLGDAIAYSDKVLLKQPKSPMYLSIPLQENPKFMVSMTEAASPVEVCRYLAFDEKLRFASLAGKRILNGDVIMLRNRENAGFLTVGDWAFRKALLETKIKIANADEKFASIQNLFSLNQLTLQKIQDCYQEIEAFLDTSPSTFHHFWEVQSLNPLKGSILEYKDPFRLKNMANGLFLAVNKTTGAPMLVLNPTESNEFSLDFHFEKGHSTEGLSFQGTVKVASCHSGWILKTKRDQRKLVFEPKKSGETGRFSFELLRFSARKIEVRDLELVSACFCGFLDFYIFLQGFGMIEQENEQKNPNEFLLTYDYERAVFQERELEEEVSRFMLRLDCLFGFLDGINSDRLYHRQLLIKELKVFELEMLLCRLIDDLVFANKNSKEHRIKSQLKAGESALNSAFRFSEKSAFFIARKHLETPIKAIFRFLGLLVQGNPINAEIFLENAEFFTNQLRVYTQETSLIFKCALSSNASEVPQLNEQLMDWLGSLESLNEKLRNIDDQTELIEVISHSLVNAEENAIRGNQQRVQMELFSHRGGSEMKKGLLRFGIKDGNPVIILKKDTELSEFLANNPSLAKLNIIKLKEKEDSASFFLADLLNNPELLPHVRYISAVLAMIALLVRDRNAKVINKVNSLEISPTHILNAVNLPDCPLPVRAGYFQLFEALYLDREPFARISKYSNRCILWTEIQEFSLENPNYHLLNLEDLKNPEKEGEKVINEQFRDITAILSDFWSEQGPIGLSLENMGMREKLEFAVVMLKITRKSIDLGYTKPSFNQKVFSQMARAIEITLGGISQEGEGFWLGGVLSEASGSRSYEREYNKLLLEIFKGIETYYEVLRIIQIHIFMRLFMENFEDFTIKPNFEELFTLSPPPKPKQSSHFGTRPLITTKFSDARILKTLEASAEPPGVKTCELDVSILLFLLRSKYLPNPIILQVLRIIACYFELRKSLFDELLLIELIDGKKEEALYKELDGTPDLFGQVISPKKLEFQIEKILTEYDDHNKDVSQRENKIRELNNVINKLNSKFRETLNLEKGLFGQMQNIIRNLEVHSYIFRLLAVRSSKKPQEERELFGITIEFFELFCLENETNQNWVLEKVHQFLELLFHRIPIHKLLIAALARVKSRNEKIAGVIELLFGFLRGNVGKAPNRSPHRKFIGLEILIVLKSMIFEQKTGVPIPENQKKVLNLLLKHEFLLKFAKMGGYFETRNRLVDEVRRGNKLDSFAFHLGLVELLSFLACDFKLGVLQLRKLLVFEQLKSLIYDPATPFLFKKPYLRVVFSVYFLPTDDENGLPPEEFSQFLTNILLDIQSSYYFIEFLVKPQKNQPLTEEIKRFRADISNNRAVFLEKMGNNEGNNPDEKPRNKKPTTFELHSSETRRVLADGTEYWKYCYGGSKKFIGRKDGLLRILSETMSEVQRRKIPIPSELFDRLHRTLLKLKTALSKIEKTANISLTRLQLVIHESMSRFPSLKSSQKPNNPARVPRTFDETGAPQDHIKVFLGTLALILERKKLSVTEFQRLYGFLGPRPLVSRDEFIEKTREILEKLGPDCEIRKEELSGFVETFMQFKKSVSEFTFQRFLRKLAKTIENRRAIYQREALKSEKMALLRLEEDELSRQKKESLRIVIQWFEKDCILRSRDAEIHSMVRRFTARLREIETSKVSGLLSRLIEVFAAHGNQAHLLKFLELLTEDLKNPKDSNKELSSAIFESGILRQALGELQKEAEAVFLEMGLRILLNCLAIDSKKSQEEVLGILESVEDRGLMVQVFGFVKTCLSYQEGRLFKASGSRKSEDFKSVLIKTIRFLALCCENCYQPFQNFLREQVLEFNAIGLASSNIVTMTAELLGIIPRNPLDYELIEEILKTLIKYCLGPCEENQNVLSNNKTLFRFLNEAIFSDELDFMSENPNHLKKIRVFHMAVKLLLSLTDANHNLDSIIAFLELDRLIEKMTVIYQDRVKPNVKAILNGERVGSGFGFPAKSIETGFDIFVLLSILKDASVSNPRLATIGVDSPRLGLNLRSTALKKPTRKMNIKSNKIFPLNELKNEVLVAVEEQSGSEDLNTSIAISEPGIEDEEVSLRKRARLEESLSFYKALVGNVEIVNKGTLRKVFFPKPFLSIYRTENIRRDLLYEARHRNLKVRLEHFLRNIARYKGEMQHFRMIGRIKLLNLLVGSWRAMKDLSLVLIIFIVSFLLISGDSYSLFIISRAVTIIQLLLGVFVAIFCIVERFPMSMGRSYPFHAQLSQYIRKIDYFPQSVRFFSLKYLLCTKISGFYKRLDSGHWRLLKVFIDIENFSNILYLALTVIAFTNPYYYAFMLLDIIKRSKTIQFNLRTVTENWVQLLKLAALIILIVYMFAVVSYSQYPQRFNQDRGVYGTTLWEAFFTIWNEATRREEKGGLGWVLDQPQAGDKDYWDFWWMTLWFWLLIHLFLLKMVFWMIIDKFRELRERRKRLENEIMTQCFICGINRKEFELRGNGWKNHRLNEHNVYNYLDFAMYIQEKELRDCNELEKYLKEMLEKNNTGFFPMNRAITLEKGN